MTRDLFADLAREAILHTDIELLNKHNVSDDTMSIMAAEHAARTETLAKAIDPTLGKALLLMIAGHLMKAAKQIDAATVQEPELVTHG
ncbi:hypothetical protein SAMN03159338_1624 [Sphingomonas sp. NFR04]|jgi:hypothetical protein|uniref:hypothetical protein n=1 Tax=Sphingomonas sp. NFR04 TaxID=1566283 RepID=UPI0008EDB334|nr:hypothetical protein [Sphingomonas sp. NFR04]SFJ51449.1 hypothetical protein SAMN03159338_1624 [Sphingomonas sp. NFR04]